MPRYVLTGTPGAGKTAVLRLLEVNGHVVVEEAATDIIALDHALGHERQRHDHAFIDKIVTLQRQRQHSVRATDGVAVFFDRSPVCTLALSRYLGLTVSRMLVREVDRVLAESVYETTVFFIRNQGSSKPPRPDGSVSRPPWCSSVSTNRPIVTSGSGSSRYLRVHCPTASQ